MQQGGGGLENRKKKKCLCCVRSFSNKRSKMECQGETCCVGLQNDPDIHTVHPVLSML